ncbi:uncharacterized protein LOC121301003 [Polyodon spathula]|uniref:uncharacterized protein LOC121301003 n=1 Tax=Polyodon spathula TaxID=7913 RepID=UPI001B7D9332|nr:uncharacterized protein LOC121301003 [Polyodon spathula]
MDVSVSVSCFQDELASTIEHAVKAAVDTVLCAIIKVVGSKFTEFQVEMAGKEKENESLKLRLGISERELKAARGCINAADADIKQPLIFQGLVMLRFFSSLGLVAALHLWSQGPPFTSTFCQ